MNPAKIMEIGPYPPPRAGWAVRTEYVVKALRQQGHTCMPLNLGRNRKVKSPEYEDVQGGKDFVRKVFRYCRKGYLMHTHANGDSPKGFVLTLLAQSIPRLFGRRAVLTFHAGPDQLYFPRGKSRKHIPVFKLLFGLPRAIICNNEAVKARIVEYGISPAKIAPIPAFSKQYLEFQEVDLAPDLERFIGAHSPLFCTYLMYREEFHVDSVMQAISQLTERWPDLGMVIMGAGDATEQIQQLVRSHRIEANIHHAGDMLHDAFLTVFKRSKLYLRSHARDGVCSSVLEALSLGVPVVASEDGIRPPSVITFELGNAAEMAKRLAYALENHDQVRAEIQTPEIQDTLKDEVQLLVNAYHAETGEQAASLTADQEMDGKR